MHVTTVSAHDAPQIVSYIYQPQLLGQSHDALLNITLSENQQVLEGFTFYSTQWPVQKIFVRPHYSKLFERLIFHEQRKPDFTPTQILTGTPGVGKSLFSFYVLYNIFHRVGKDGNTGQDDPYQHLNSIVFVQMASSSRFWAFERDKGTKEWKAMGIASTIEKPDLYIYDCSWLSQTPSEIIVGGCINIIISSPRVSWA